MWLGLMTRSEFDGSSFRTRYYQNHRCGKVVISIMRYSSNHQCMEQMRRHFVRMLCCRVFRCVRAKKSANHHLQRQVLIDQAEPWNANFAVRAQFDPSALDKTRMCINHDHILRQQYRDTGNTSRKTETASTSSV